MTAIRYTNLNRELCLALGVKDLSDVFAVTLRIAVDQAPTLTIERHPKPDQFVIPSIERLELRAGHADPDVHVNVNNIEPTPGVESIRDMVSRQAAEGVARNVARSLVQSPVMHNLVQALSGANAAASHLNGHAQDVAEASAHLIGLVAGTGATPPVGQVDRADVSDDGKSLHLTVTVNDGPLQDAIRDHVAKVEAAWPFPCGAVEAAPATPAADAPAEPNTPADPLCTSVTGESRARTRTLTPEQGQRLMHWDRVMRGRDAQRDALHKQR